GGAVAAGDEQAADTGFEVAPAILDRLPHELLLRVAALLENDPPDRVADHVAARQAGALVEQIETRGAALHRAPFGVPLGDRVALADLRAVEVDAVVETGRRFERDATGRGGADVHHVDNAARPGEQLARVLGVEDRDEGL